MSKDDRMFEKLGYTKEVKPNHIRYVIKYGFFIPDTFIDFIKNEKRIWIDDTIDMNELQAINEKCKEWGWIE